MTTAVDRLRLYGQEDHGRIYGRDYGLRLEDAGFDVRQDCYIRELAPELVARYQLPHDEDIYLCRKPR